MREIAEEMLQTLLRLSAWGLHDSRMDELRSLAEGYRAALERSDLPVGRPYFCPASGEVEQRGRSGFDVCCDRPDLHLPVGQQSKDFIEVERFFAAAGAQRFPSWWTVYDAQAAILVARVRAQVTEDLSALLADLVDPDVCSFDHHGFCQAHGWMVTEPPCPHGRAKALLAEQAGKGFPSSPAALPDVVGTPDHQEG